MTKNRKSGTAQAVDDQAFERDCNALVAQFSAGDLAGAEARARALLNTFPRALILYDVLVAALSEQGKLDEAAACCRKALEINPDYPEAHNNLGIVLKKSDLLIDAAESFLRALQIRPGYREALINLSQAIRGIDPADITASLAEPAIHCLESPRVNSNVVRTISHTLLQQEIEKLARSGAETPADLARLPQVMFRLLIAHLRNSLVRNRDLELVLTGVRAAYLNGYAADKTLKLSPQAAAELLEALAWQGFLNEHVWYASPEETTRVDDLQSALIDTIQKGDVPSSSDLYLLAAFRPLHQIAAVRQWALNTELADTRLREALTHWVENPATETELAATMERLTPIDDAISLAVRAQYEENPYPRWNSLTMAPPVGYTRKIAEEIAPHEPELSAGTDEPAILVAGCGSGQQPIATALYLRNAKVAAIDLSLASLAYAKRMAREMGVHNIRFAQADILKLGMLEERFDVIECVGVLHHMADPEAGLTVLLGLLKPGGFLKLALYSETARREIVHLRETLPDLSVASSPDQIRVFRHELLASESPRDMGLRAFGDFYAMSSFRDLLLHVQEHRFTLQQIDEMLRRHDLTLLGMVVQDSAVKPEFVRRFPEDPDCLDLGNWHLFENDHPQTFGNMYQFWCRKSG